MRILVTGAAGFIGFHLCRRLCFLGHEVVGIDNLNNYYSTQLKQDRLKELTNCSGFVFHKLDLAHEAKMEELFVNNCFDAVVNLAAQAGVRYSLENPRAYIESNVSGFLNVLEGCRNNKVGHLLFASSSSVYGLNSQIPFSEHDSTAHPISMYAATKKSNEMMAHSYSHLFKLPATGLRFFTVYGPWGRPDMALFIFTKAIIEGTPVPVFNHGEMRRDFTYIDDIIDGIVGIVLVPPVLNSQWDARNPDPATSSAPYALYNIGNNKSVPLGKFIDIIESCIGKKAIKRFLPMQAGDVKETYANVDRLSAITGFSPSTPIEVGIKSFVDWYTGYYGK